MAAGSYTLRKTYVDGDILSASDYVADHQQHIDNQDPQHTDDYSLNVTQMRTYTDTGDVNSESLATTLAGELERLRYQVKHIKEKINGSTITQWYSKSYALTVPNASVTSAKIAVNGTYIQTLRAVNAGYVGIDNATQTTVLTQAITTTRLTMRIMANASFIGTAGDGASHAITVRLKRGATVLATKIIHIHTASAATESMVTANFAFIDLMGAGTFTYTVTAQKGDAVLTAVNEDCDMVLEEIA